MTQPKSDLPAVSPDRRTVAVETGEAGERLDRFLAARLGDLSRSRVKALIEQGMVAESEGPATDPSQKVKPGQCFTVTLPPPEAATPDAQDIPLTVVYEDDDLIVIDKPAGMVVHPAPGNPDSTLVNALLGHCGDTLSGIGGVRRPGIVHRIDKDTSGLLVAAKNDLAHASLTGQFAAHSIDRAYLALVWGVPMPPAGEIAGNIGRSNRDRKKMAVVGTSGKHALTRYRTLGRYGALVSLVECRLETGRTHQIRVHMASIGHPLVGDAPYGGRRNRSPANKNTGSNDPVKAALSGFPRQALHARELGFQHPRTGKRILFQSALPADMAEILALLGLSLPAGN
ncbi:MAG: RluA family pseudouridine synthase [Oceanibaculum nanhaiense]|uniref:RluA family pseudouridine synthase n=1 Tax=Oceanibaculum nanhaiense TaxID=1909734 RepID=UPI0025A3559D|nr:RluA family pseudouridine synthase [Oceanibaculum nanhaiense]MDM7946072.1 RluA family pseudouridine synthase [Oceanibaculum nanhaiense]